MSGLLISKRITGEILEATRYTFVVRTSEGVRRVKRRTLGAYLVRGVKR